MANKQQVQLPKLVVNTVIFQSMVSRSIKGASQNKLIPLTSLMAIRVADKQLTLITTDASNTLYITQDFDGADFYCVVQVDQFSKLISRITSETITLEVKDSILNVTGNGNYRIELPLDENGETIQYPDPVSDIEVDGDLKEISLATIKTILTANKASLAVTMEEPEYTGYYAGHKVVTTDRCKICSLDADLFGEPVLLAPETVNLLEVMTEEKIKAVVQDDIVEFITKDCIVYGHVMNCLQDFAIEAISDLLDEKFASSCTVSKTDLLALLDRVGLFVGTYDNHAITFTFTDTGIDVSSKQSNGVETIPYISSKNPKPYVCRLDILMLIQQIKANSADALNIQYGNDQSIKFVDGNVTQVLALLEDEQ